MTEVMQERELVFAALATNKDEYVLPNHMVQAFMESLREEDRAGFLRRRPENRHDDIQLNAAKWQMRQYSLEEAHKNGYTPEDSGFIGLEHMVPIDSAVGLEAGMNLARKYQFEEGRSSIMRHGVMPTSHLFIHEKRRIGDAILFIGSNEKASGNDEFTVAIVYAPIEYMEKYSPYKSLPGY